ncbi:MAG: acyltransferase, partial [Proteobacteria bacterium]|nr:acyltransferase [Pseudomonadota bacterium]
MAIQDAEQLELRGPHTLQSGHIPALDGIRGLAVIMVLLFHFICAATPLNNIEALVIRFFNYGAYGVELFFVLSGFLITGILYDARSKPNYFKNFYIRRTLRIFPLYYGVLFLTFVVAPLIPWLSGPTLSYMAEHQAWAWLYATNVFIAIKGYWAYAYLEHFWSLSVEEHFYLFWPFLVYWLAPSPRRLMAASLAVAAASAMARTGG